MTDDDLPWRPSRELSLAPAALCQLEDALSPDNVFATADVGADTLAVLLDGKADSDARIAIVRIDALNPPAWTEVSRHGWWATEGGNASEALAALVDRRRSEVPVQDSPDDIEPAIVVPCRQRHRDPAPDDRRHRPHDAALRPPGRARPLPRSMADVRGRDGLGDVRGLIAFPGAGGGRSNGDQWPMRWYDDAP